jgi:outer membrane lipoprotein-sorting protein
VEKYRVTLLRMNWLPVRIERYTQEGKSIEIDIIQNYRINTGLEDNFFVP